MRSWVAVSGAAVAAWLIVLVPGSAHAYRPFDGTDGDVAELGEFELELGPVEVAHTTGYTELHIPSMVLNLGILPRTELTIDSLGVYPLDDVPGEEKQYSVRDLAAALKFLLRKGVLQEESGPSIGLETGVILPEINGESGFGLGANLILSEQWDWFIVHLNNEAELSRSELLFVWSNALITEFKFDDVAWPVAQFAWEIEPSSGDKVFSGLIGGIWELAEDFALDAAFVVAREEDATSYEGRLGFTWAVPFWESGEGEGAGPNGEGEEQIHD